MQDTSDAQLLRQYAAGGNEAAFREIVARHTDLVYSAALRQVMVADLAQDISQSVFVDLARKAKEVGAQLAAEASLVGWLYRSTRFAVLKHLRDNRRRVMHERQAMEQLITDRGPGQDWERICPFLDDAMESLDETDRAAILLRYFENKSLREVGRSLETSDDAAQKRVSRAVERLREFFSKRGIAIGASGLIVVISANAVHAAPIALATSISTAAVLGGTTVHTSTAIAATKAIAMTTLQKILVVSTVTALIGAGIYQAHQTARLHQQIKSLGEQQTPLTAQIQQLQHDLSDAADRLAAMQAENSKLKSNQSTAELMKLRGEVGRLTEVNKQLSSPTNDSRAALIKSWLERREKLKQLVEQYPDKSIPEFQLLSEQQWLNAAMNAKFDSDTNVLQDLADLRHTAENNFAAEAHDALAQYMKQHDGQFPTDLSQLQPYFKGPMDEAILNRWEIVPQSAFPNQGFGGDWVITEKSTIDSSLDNRWAIGAGGYGNSSYQSAEVKDAMVILNPALKAYAIANNGKQPTSPSDIVPYLTTPEQQAAYQKLLQNRSRQ